MLSTDGRGIKRGPSAVSDEQGHFTISKLLPGSYTVMVSYVGFAAFETSATVTPNQVTHVDAILQIASESQAATVNGDRQFGEVEAINIERIADNIVQVMPSQAITREKTRCTEAGLKVVTVDELKSILTVCRLAIFAI